MRSMELPQGDQQGGRGPLCARSTPTTWLWDPGGSQRGFKVPQGTQGAETASDTNKTNKCVNKAMCMICEDSPEGPEGPKFLTAINTEGPEGLKFSTAINTEGPEGLKFSTKNSARSGGDGRWNLESSSRLQPSSVK